LRPRGAGLRCHTRTSLDHPPVGRSLGALETAREREIYERIFTHTGTRTEISRQTKGAMIC
jgi:hypothetical protein